MTESEATSAVLEALTGDSSIPVKLRLKSGFDRNQFLLLKISLERLIELHQHREMILKRLASAFVDVRTLFLSSSGLYTQAEVDEIEDAAEEVVDLAYQLLAR